MKSKLSKKPPSHQPAWNDRFRHEWEALPPETPRKVGRCETNSAIGIAHKIAMKVYAYVN